MSLKMDVEKEPNENSPDGSERRRKSERRTSILKPPKPRNPLQELDFQNEANEAVQPTRRVSFSRAQIQEFAQSRGKHIWGSTYYVDVCQSDSSIKNATSSDVSGEHNLTNCSDCIYVEHDENTGMEITNCVESYRTKIFNSSSESNNMELTMINDVTSRQPSSIMQHSRNCTKIFDSSASSNKIDLTGDYGIILCESNVSNNLEFCDTKLCGEDSNIRNISNNLCTKNATNNCTKIWNTSGADISLSVCENIGGIFSDSGASVLEQSIAMPDSNKIERTEDPFEISEIENQKGLDLTETCGGIVSNDLPVQTDSDYQVKLSNEISPSNEQVIETCLDTFESCPEHLSEVQPHLDSLRSVGTQLVTSIGINKNSSLNKEMICSEPTSGIKDCILPLKIQNLNTNNAIDLKHCTEKNCSKENRKKLDTEINKSTNKNYELVNNMKDLYQIASCTLSDVNVQNTKDENIDLVSDKYLLMSQIEFSESNKEVSNKITAEVKEKSVINKIGTVINTQSANDENIDLVTDKHLLRSQIEIIKSDKEISNNKTSAEVEEKSIINNIGTVINTQSANDENIDLVTDKHLLMSETEFIKSDNEVSSKTFVTGEEKFIVINESENDKLSDCSGKFLDNNASINICEANKLETSNYCTSDHNQIGETENKIADINENENMLNQTSSSIYPKNNDKCETHAQNLTISYQQLIENDNSVLEVSNSSERSMIFQISRKRRNNSSFILESKKKSKHGNNLILSPKEFTDTKMEQFNDKICLQTSKAISNSNGSFNDSTSTTRSDIVKENEKLNDCKTQEANTQRCISYMGKSFKDHEMCIENESNVIDKSVSSSSLNEMKCSKDLDIFQENALKRKAEESVTLWRDETSINESSDNLQKDLVKRKMITPLALKKTLNKLSSINFINDRFFSMENMCLSESEKQEIESKLRRKINQSSQNTRIKSLKQKYDENEKKFQTHKTNMNLFYEKQKKYKKRIVSSDYKSPNVTSIFFDSDNSVILTEEPLSAMDGIVAFKESNKCAWEIERVSEREWIFSFLRKIFNLDIILEDKHITTIKFLKIPVENEIMKFVQHVVIKSFSPDKIMEMCKTEMDIMNLLNKISQKIEDMLIFKSDIELLQDCYMLEFFANCASLKFFTFKSHIRFKLSIDLSAWDNIKPEDIIIRDYYGNLRVDEVVNLAFGIQKDSHYLMNYIKAIHEYLDVLEKYEKE